MAMLVITDHGEDDDDGDDKDDDDEDDGYWQPLWYSSVI